MIPHPLTSSRTSARTTSRIAAHILNTKRPIKLRAQHRKIRRRSRILREPSRRSPLDSDGYRLRHAISCKPTCAKGRLLHRAALSLACHPECSRGICSCFRRPYRRHRARSLRPGRICRTGSFEFRLSALRHPLRNLRPLRLHVRNMNHEPLAHRPLRATDRIKRHRNIPWIQQSVKLRPARAKFPRHSLLRFPLFFHSPLKLPRQHALDRHCLYFFPDSSFFKKAIEGRTAMICRASGRLLRRGAASCARRS